MYNHVCTWNYTANIYCEIPKKVLQKYFSTVQIDVLLRGNFFYLNIPWILVQSLTSLITNLLYFGQSTTICRSLQSVEETFETWLGNAHKGSVAFLLPKHLQCKAGKTLHKYYTNGSKGVNSCQLEIGYLSVAKNWLHYVGYNTNMRTIENIEETLELCKMSLVSQT